MARACMDIISFLSVMLTYNVFENGLAIRKYILLGLYLILALFSGGIMLNIIVESNADNMKFYVGQK